MAPAFSPCGAIVGVGTHGYEAPVRWYPGGPLGRIRFYEVPATNKRFMLPTIFVPYFHDDEGNVDGVGEITGYRLRKHNDAGNTYPARDGTHFEGDAADFVGQGSPPWAPAIFTPRAFLPECDFPSLHVFKTPRAGIISGAKGNHDHIWDAGGVAGILAAAAGEFTRWRTLSGLAGILSGGDATFKRTHALTGLAGAICGAEGAIAHIHGLEAPAGILSGGDATIGHYQALGSSAGLLSGATADLFKVRGLESVAGILSGGDATLKHFHGLTSTAGILGGAGAELVKVREFGSAAGILSGAEANFGKVRRLDSVAGILSGAEANFGKVRRLDSVAGILSGADATWEKETMAIWVKFSKSYLDFVGLGGTNGTVSLYNAAKTHILDIVIKTTTPWAGPSMVSGSVLAGAFTYLSNYDLKAAASDTNYMARGQSPAMNAQSFAATSIGLKVECFADLLSTLTAGAVDVWLLISTVP